MSRKVLFVTYGGGHVSMVLPVIRQLRLLAPDIECVLMALTTAYGIAKNAGEQPLGYKDFLHLVDEGQALQWGASLLGTNISPDVSREESIAYLGINYLDLIAQRGQAGAAQLYAEKGRYGFAPLRFMYQLMGAIKPDVVVATNSPRSEEAALEVAIGCGVPSVGMVDLFGLDRDPYVFRDNKPDWTCVISEIVKQRLVARGFDASRVVATGNPAFDGLFSAENKRNAANFIERQGWGELSPILWAGHKEAVGVGLNDARTGHEFALEVEAALREFVRKRSESALIVRYHPNEWHTFARLKPQARVHFSVPSLEPIHPMILAAKIVVVQNSTVGLEAAVAGVPVVSLEYAPSVEGSFSLAQMLVTTPCHFAEDLPGILDGLSVAKTPIPTQYASDAKASARVASVIATAMRAMVSSHLFTANFS